MKDRKTYSVYHLSSEEATLKSMLKYNGYGIGYGPQKNKKKYSRKLKYKVNYFEE